MRKDIIAAGILVIFIVLAGCTGQQATSSYSVDSRGILSVSCAPATTSEEILLKNDTYTKTRIVQQTQRGDVVTYLAAPQNPKAAQDYYPPPANPHRAFLRGSCKGSHSCRQV